MFLRLGGQRETHSIHLAIPQSETRSLCCSGELSGAWIGHRGVSGLTGGCIMCGHHSHYKEGTGYFHSRKIKVPSPPTSCSSPFSCLHSTVGVNNTQLWTFLSIHTVRSTIKYLSCLLHRLIISIFFYRLLHKSVAITHSPIHFNLQYIITCIIPLTIVFGFVALILF